MPRTPDKNLEQRILNAARRLCHMRGGRGLTLRAVARAAGTTTPTVYKRFRNKAALRLALARQIREELLERIFSAPQIEQFYRRYIQFSEENPEDYEILRETWTEIFAPSGGRPGMNQALSELAKRFGGKSEEYMPVFYALFLLCHGAATLLGVPGSEAVRTEIREQCIGVCDRLIQHVDTLRSAE
ncbi:MAG: TetR/AcrR family transcriptional regulator [Candidatus Acidiferrales bacterium]